MNVTFTSSVGQRAFSRVVRRCGWAAAGLMLTTTLGAVSLPPETHRNFQAVTANGLSAWTPAYPVTLVGVLLTDPDEMLDSTPDFQPASSNTMGGQWQMVLQTVFAGDRGGTFCWMGQNYAIRRPPGDDSFSYSNEAWLAEIQRLNHDPATGHAFQKGDLVAVTANGSLFFGGKRNVNEMHRNEPEYDFTISLVASNFGLPTPEVLSLASLVRTNDNNPDTSEDIFDPTRMSGGEYWQGMRVRINGLTLVNSAGWNPTNTWAARLCTVTDGENRFFRLRHPRYSLGPAPTGQFDAIGILNQESGSGLQGTNGYELFVQQVLPSEPAELLIGSHPVITWPGALANYQLQFTNRLGGPGEWQPVTNESVLVNGRWTVVIDPVEAQTRFYRLQRVQ